MTTKKPRIVRLVEAVRAQRWHDANVIISRLIEAKVMARLDRERKQIFMECPLDGDGGSPMSPKKLKEDDDDDDGNDHIATPKGPVSTRSMGTAKDYGSRGDNDEIKEAEGDEGEPGEPDPEDCCEHGYTHGCKACDPDA
jgi:hypothetical protein